MVGTYPLSSPTIVHFGFVQGHNGCWLLLSVCLDGLVTKFYYIIEVQCGDFKESCEQPECASAN